MTIQFFMHTVLFRGICLSGFALFASLGFSQTAGLSSASADAEQPALAALPVDVDIIMLDSLATSVVTNDDQIVIGSLAVGLDAVDGMDFGFNTIIMAENNTRLKFFDTSSSSSFPYFSWTLRANESAAGGANCFAIDIADYSASDESYSHTPFTIDGSAIDSAFVIGSQDVELKVDLKFMSAGNGVEFADGTTLTSANEYQSRIDSLATVATNLATAITNLANSLATVATSGAYEDLSGTESLSWGESAYDIWLSNGNSGTELEFINSLKGDTGAQGAQGAQGPQGATGLQGPQGPLGLTGPQGPTGAQGPQGIQGPMGPAGADGADGADGTGMPALAGSDSDNDGAIPFFDGDAGVWTTVKPNSTFGKKNVPLKLCDGIPTWGPCVKVTGTRFDMDY